LQTAARAVQVHAAIEFLFCGGEAGDFGLCFGQFQFVRGEFVLGSGLPAEQTLQSIVVTLQTIAFGNRWPNRRSRVRRHRCGPGTGCAEIVLCFQQTGARWASSAALLSHSVPAATGLFDLLASCTATFQQSVNCARITYGETGSTLPLLRMDETISS
jgi:hypothetical protein